MSHNSDRSPAPGLLGLDIATPLLACAVCKQELLVKPVGLQCCCCGKTYRIHSGIPFLLPEEDLSYEATEAARVRKRQVQERYAFINSVLPKPFGTFATYLNLGYASNADDPLIAKRPRGVVFNKYSSRLLCEVIRNCDLNGKAVLEVGSGRGGNLAAIQQLFNCTVSMGLDLAPANAAFCRERHDIERGLFVVGDAEHLPFRASAFDVLLNLESSHYYPNILKFFDEAHRTLIPGGQLLYADILPAAVFADVESHVLRLGFQIVRNHDITDNVLLSCTEIARVRESNRRNGMYETFLILPGTPEFLEMKNGTRLYKMLGLQKPLAL